MDLVFVWYVHGAENGTNDDICAFSFGRGLGHHFVTPIILIVYQYTNKCLWYWLSQLKLSKVVGNSAS